MTLVTMSEFDRTVKENGNRGTDHGHANVMLLLGGGVKGGRIYSRWPGLDSSHLFENRDLAVTTDFREVFAEILEKRLAIADLKPVFPGYDLARTKRLGLIEQTRKTPGNRQENPKTSLSRPSILGNEAGAQSRASRNDREEVMKTLFAICLIGILVLAGCGAGPTAPQQGSVEATPAPAPAPTAPCHPMPKCQGEPS